jgi:hypothetical protein
MVVVALLNGLVAFERGRGNIPTIRLRQPAVMEPDAFILVPLP